MAVENDVTIAVALFVVAIVGVAILEMRFLRKRMKGRRIRTAKRDAELLDEAHNAIVTTKAIMSTMDRQGIRSQEASAWVREADVAQARRNYRVTIDLTGKAKDRLLSLKAAQSSRGDLAKLEKLGPNAGSDEPTTKELIQKEFPPNLVQSKFSIELAGTAITQGQEAGRDVGPASQLLETAKARFDGKDYAAALTIARQSKRSADGDVIEASIPPSPGPSATVVGSRPCPTCGSSLQADDVFCRKCGTKLAPAACSSCGADLLPDDAFCRKCGKPLT